MRLPRHLVAILIVSTLLINCQKNYHPGDIDPAYLPAITVTANVSGRVTAENGEPIKGATVRAGISVFTTDINGYFYFQNVNIADKAAFVKVEKPGYFTGSRTFVARQGQSHYVEVELIKKTLAGTVNASAGGTVTLSNGSVVTLPANGIVSPGGTPYTGQVSVFMAWIDPSSEYLFRQMPGTLRGIDENGEQKALRSYGMIGVELESAAGEKLQIAEGKKAALEFPIAAAMQANAPDSIALWWFDDNQGLWKQEGFAQRSGNAFQAEVKHFSFWNVDVPYPLVIFSATFKDQSGQPLRYYRILLSFQGTAMSYYANTDSTGFITGLVPKNEQLVLKVLPQDCSVPVHVQNIGPFSAQSNMNVTVNLPSANLFILNGIANNCFGSPVSSGYLEIIMAPGNRVYRSPIANGNINLQFTNCTPTQAMQYVVVDNATSQQSNPVNVTLNAGTHNLGTIAACGVSSVQFMNFTVDGASFSLISPTDSLYALGGNASLFGIYGTSPAGNKSVRMDISYIGSAVPGIGGENTLIHPSHVRIPNDTLLRRYPDRIQVTFTEYANVVGSFFSGHFDDTLYTNNLTVPHRVQCNFRVKRIQ